MLGATSAPSLCWRACSCHHSGSKFTTAYLDFYFCHKQLSRQSNCGHKQSASQTCPLISSLNSLHLPYSRSQTFSSPNSLSASQGQKQTWDYSDQTAYGDTQQRRSMVLSPWLPLRRHASWYWERRIPEALPTEPTPDTCTGRVAQQFEDSEKKAHRSRKQRGRLWRLLFSLSPLCPLA